MTRSELGCDEVVRILGLEDLDFRLDRAALERHLQSCADCSRLAPELPMILADSPIIGPVPDLVLPANRSRFRPVAAAVVAASILAVFVVLVGRDGGKSEFEAMSSGDSGRSRVLPSHFSRSRESTIVDSDGERIESTFTRGASRTEAPRTTESDTPMSWMSR